MMKCLILAGGFGKRVSQLTGGRAKALLEYRGRPLISHIVDRIPRNIEILVTTNKKFEADLLGWQKSVNRKVELLVEGSWSECQKLGALESINYWAQIKQINEDLLVIAGDNYFEFDINRFISAYDGVNTLVAVYETGAPEKARDFGVIKMKERKIIEFTEKPVRPDSSLIATACYIFPPRVLRLCIDYCLKGKIDSLGRFIAYLVEEDEVDGFFFTEKWFDIGSEIQMPGAWNFPNNAQE